MNDSREISDKRTTKPEDFVILLIPISFFESMWGVNHFYQQLSGFWNDLGAVFLVYTPLLSMIQGGLFYLFAKYLTTKVSEKFMKLTQQALGVLFMLGMLLSLLLVVYIVILMIGSAPLGS